MLQALLLRLLIDFDLLYTHRETHKMVVEQRFNYKIKYAVLLTPN